MWLIKNLFYSVSNDWLRDLYVDYRKLIIEVYKQHKKASGLF